MKKLLSLLALALVSVASFGLQVDYTSRIVNPSFETSGGWNGNPTIGGAEGYKCAEVFNRSFDVNQTIENLPEGIYIIYVQGFYRDGSFDKALKDYKNNIGSKCNAYFYGNDVAYPFVSLFSVEIPEGEVLGGGNGLSDEYNEYWYANNMIGASNAFSAGYYKCAFWVYVYGTDKLTIGARKTSGNTPEFNWTVFDNFELDYIGNSSDVWLHFRNSIYTTTFPAGTKASQNLLNDYQTAANNFNAATQPAKIVEYYRAIVRLKAEIEDNMKLIEEVQQFADELSQTKSLFSATASAEAKSRATELLGKVNNICSLTTEQINQLIEDIKKCITALRECSQASYHDPVDFTKVITNPSFEDGNLNGWTVNTAGDTGAKPNSTPYTCENADGNYLFNTWDDGKGYPISQTIENLPNGVYSLYGMVTSGTKYVYLFANGGMKDANNDVVNRHERANAYGITDYLEEEEFDFIVEDGTITIGAVGAAEDGESYDEGGYSSWYKADNFKLKYRGNNVMDYLSYLSDEYTRALQWLEANEESLSAEKKTNLSNAITATRNILEKLGAGTTVDDCIVAFKNLYAALAEAQEPPHYTTNEAKLITTAANNLDGVVAVITDPAGEKTWGAFSTEHDGQDIGSHCTSVYDWSSKSEYCYVKFYHVAGQADDVYYVKFVNAAGNWYNPRGDWHGNQGCMNVTGDGTGLFVGGITDKNGQDVQGGALWKVTKTAEGYTLCNVGKGVYAVPGIGVTSTATSLKLYTEFDLYDPAAKKADAVIEKINAIGIVEYTEACKALIDAAREAYDALTDGQKAYITAEQLKVLTDAEAEYQRLKDIATGIADVNAQEYKKNGKYIKNRKVVIVKNDKEYNAQGQKM